MKIAILSDLHANFTALKAVFEHIRRWQPDRVIIGGDIANRGPRPLDCLEFVIDQESKFEWRTIRGNHEDYVISWSRSHTSYQGTTLDVHQASGWTYHQLKSDVSALQAMPFQQSIWGPDGREVRIVHGSMIGNRDGIYPETNKSALYQKAGLDNEQRPPAALCVGHTHRPLIRRINDVLVVNVGSAGLPFDGDIRPAYSQITYQNGRWSAKIVRVDYEHARAIKDFQRTGYMSNAGPLSQLVMIELRDARSLLYYWAEKYQQRVLDGDITMSDSVQEFILGL